MDEYLPTDLPVERIRPNPSNLRHEVGDVSELAASMESLGLIHPVTVREDPLREGWYILEAGERRWTAARAIGWRYIAGRIRIPQGAEGISKGIEIAFVENYHRLDLSAMEKARGFERLRRQAHLSEEEIARRCGVTGATVSTYLALTELDAKSQQMVEDGRLSVRDAVRAVRRTRAAQRKKKGHAPVSAGWEPDWWTDKHPLNRKARIMCDARQHNNRRRQGGACGQCWETVIRNDQDIVREAARAALEVPFITPQRASVNHG